MTQYYRRIIYNILATLSLVIISFFAYGPRWEPEKEGIVLFLIEIGICFFIGFNNYYFFKDELVKKRIKIDPKYATGILVAILMFYLYGIFSLTDFTRLF